MAAQVTLLVRAVQVVDALWYLQGEIQRGLVERRVVVLPAHEVVGRQGTVAGAFVVVRVQVVLHQVVPLPVGTERSAGLFVDERVRHRVGTDMAHPAGRERQQLRAVLPVEVRFTGKQHPRVREQPLRYPAGAAVVQHVAPQECLLVVPEAHLQREPGEDVAGREDLLGTHRQQRVAQLGERVTEFGQQAAGQVVDDLSGLVEDRADGGVPHVEELLPQLVYLDDEAQDVGPGVADLGQDREQSVVRVVQPALVVQVVQQAQAEHDLVARDARIGVVLQEEEDVRTDRAQRGELRPVGHRLGEKPRIEWRTVRVQPLR